MGPVALQAQAQAPLPRMQERPGARLLHVLAGGHGFLEGLAFFQQEQHALHAGHIGIVLRHRTESNVHAARKDADAFAAGRAGRREEHAHRGLVGVLADAPDLALHAHYLARIDHEQHQPGAKQERTFLRASVVPVQRTAEEPVGQGKKTGHYQAADTGGGQRHEQQQKNIAQQGQSRQEVPRRDSAQQRKAGQHAKSGRADPPHGETADDKVLVQRAARSDAKGHFVAQCRPDAEEHTQKGGRQCAAGDAVGLFHGSPW